MKFPLPGGRIYFVSIATKTIPIKQFQYQNMLIEIVYSINICIYVLTKIFRKNGVIDVNVIFNECGFLTMLQLLIIICFKNVK